VLGGNVEKQVDLLQEKEDVTEPIRKAASRSCAASGRTSQPGDRCGRLHIIARSGTRPSHRQPAARPLGPAGRPGLVRALHVARGSAAAHLRRERVNAIMQRLGMPGEPIEHGW